MCIMKSEITVTVILAILASQLDLNFAESCANATGSISSSSSYSFEEVQTSTLISSEIYTIIAVTTSIASIPSTSDLLYNTSTTYTSTMNSIMSSSPMASSPIVCSNLLSLEDGGVSDYLDCVIEVGPLLYMVWSLVAVLLLIVCLYCCLWCCCFCLCVRRKRRTRTYKIDAGIYIHNTCMHYMYMHV